MLGESVYTIERAPELLAKIDLSLIKVSLAYEKQAHKLQCMNCKMFFEKTSVNTFVPNHRVIDLQKSLGVMIEGARYTTASYLYNNSPICVFCEQMFSSSAPEVSKRKGKSKFGQSKSSASMSMRLGASLDSPGERVGLSRPVSLAGGDSQLGGSLFGSADEGNDEMSVGSQMSFNTMETESTFGASQARKYNKNPDNKMEIVNNMNNGLRLRIETPINRTNVAVGRRAYQSSEVDEMGPENCITVPYLKSSRSRREADPWWEIDLGRPFHLHSLSFNIMAQKAQNTEVHAMLLKKPMGFEEPFLEKVKQKHSIANQEFNIPGCDERHLELVTWTLPPGSECVAIRVQLKGVHTLQMMEFKAYLGDNFVTHNEDASMQVTKDSYATLSPTKIRDNMVMMLSPLKKREKTTANAKKMVKEVIVKSAYVVEQSMTNLSSTIEKAYAKQEAWQKHVRDYASVFKHDEILALYDVIFKPTVIEGCKADPPAINNLPFGMKYKDEKTIDSLIDPEELMGKCLVLHHPRCELMEVHKRIRAMLLMIQSFGNHPKPSWVGELQWNHAIAKLADDPNEKLAELKNAFTLLDEHWEVSQSSYLDKHGVPRKGRKDPKTERGCSWSQFLLIFAMFMEPDKMGNKAQQLASLVFNISGSLLSKSVLSRPGTRDGLGTAPQNEGHNKSRPETAAEIFAREARTSISRGTNRDSSKQQLELEELVAKSRGNTPSAKARGVAPVTVIDGSAVVPFNGDLTVIDGVSKTEYGSVGYPGGVIPNVGQFGSMPLLHGARDPLIPPMDTRFSEYKLGNFKKRVNSEFVFPKALTLKFTEMLLEDQKLRAAGKRPVTEVNVKKDEGDDNASFMSTTTATQSIHTVEEPPPVVVKSANPADEYGAPRTCTLCSKRFAYSATHNKVLFKHIISIRRHWDPALVSKDVQMLEQGTSMFNLVTVCMFCNQLFHPDFAGGIFFPIQEKKIAVQKPVVPDADAGAVRTSPFFDSRFPVNIPVGDFFRQLATSDKRERAKTAIAVATSIKEAQRFEDERLAAAVALLMASSPKKLDEGEHQHN